MTRLSLVPPEHFFGLFALQTVPSHSIITTSGLDMPRGGFSPMRHRFGAPAMLARMIFFTVALAAIVGASPLAAQIRLESYVAFLSERDHFNSQGVRLSSAPAIIRQDRANFHLFGLRDPGDQGDRYFSDVRNREALERLMERGHASPEVISRIVNGTVTIRVDIFQSPGGDSISVTLLD